MTVRELVEILQRFDPGHPVLIDGDAGGLEKVKVVSPVKFIRSFWEETSGVFGRHGKACTPSKRE